MMGCDFGGFENLWHYRYCPNITYDIEFIYWL